ncbi:MAG: N-acetylmuramoyl-L-alanine amidase family protein [Armatimonadetes bacterium]|nr:N-acetylmuramoyl-L-alanine amidase family protein [Armatimonadota bacterium]MDW8154150.1 N-acetylmuramoyl-L-alanine amidase family protein [Armatimonadota bacterium]
MVAYRPPRSILLALSCAVLLLLSGSPALGQSALRLVVLGEEVRTDPPPLLREGVVFAPVDQAFSTYRATVTWDPARRVAEVRGGRGEAVVLRAGDPIAAVGAEFHRLPAAPFVLQDRLMVPVESVYRALGAWVKWEPGEQALHVAAQVVRLVFERSFSGTRLVVEATGPVEARTSWLRDPDRLVLDLLHAASRIETRDQEIGEVGIRRIRVGQLQVKPYITRVVLDLEDPLEAEVRAGSGFDLQVLLRPRSGSFGGPPGSSPPPAREPIPGPQDATPPEASPTPGPPPEEPPRILEVRAVREVGGFRIVVVGDRPLRFQETTLRNPPRLVVDLPGVFVPVKQELVVGGPVEVVRAAQFQVDPEVTRVVIQWRTPVPYRILAEDGGRQVVIAVQEAPTSRGRASGHVVALDPGHGGSDPGAIGVTGLVEKDVVLDVSLRLRTLLERQGIRVVMTRETDVSVDLGARVPTALQAGATVFVSIHANASVRSVIRGVETYYLKPDGMRLAILVQEELGRSLSVPDRGIRTANFKVLRDSPIPAVLVEIGYLTNPVDEALLRTPDFREKVAQALARAIMRFLHSLPPPAP